MLTVLGGFPYKQDGDAHLKFWKEPLRDTKRPFCGHGLKCFHRYEEPIHYALSLVIFFSSQYPEKAPVVDLLRLNTQQVQKPLFNPLKYYPFFGRHHCLSSLFNRPQWHDGQPPPLYLEVHIPPGWGGEGLQYMYVHTVSFCHVYMQEQDNFFSCTWTECFC